MSGLVDAMTKSTCSKRSAIISFGAHPLRLDARPGPDVVDLVRDLQPERDLEREVGLALRDRGRRAPSRSRPAPTAPTRRRAPAARPGRRRTSRPASRASASPLAHPPRRRAPDARPRCRASGAITTRLPCSSRRAEPALEAVDARQAVGIAGVEAVADVEVAGDIAHRPREAAGHRGERTDDHVRALRDAPVGVLQPDEPGESGRDADRSAAVAAGRDRALTAGDRRGRAARRAAGRRARGPTGCGSRRAASSS